MSKIGNLSLLKIYANAEIKKAVINGQVVYEKQSGIVVDPILENNTWDVIKTVCQNGEAANYWALGDEKLIAVDDVGNVPHAIVDMSANRYEYTSDSSKYSNVVFQAKDIILNNEFNASSNKSPNGDTAYNGWWYSDLRTALQSGGTIYAKYPSDLKTLLEQVKTMTAYSGMTDTLTYSDDLLFIPAVREVKANYTSYVQSSEVNSEQTQYGYYELNSDADTNRIKYFSGTAKIWWLRSPAVSSYITRDVKANGGIGSTATDGNFGVAPCFAF